MAVSTPPPHNLLPHEYPADIAYTGHAAEEAINKQRTKALASATPAEKERENGAVKVVIIRKAGHHVYLDGADHFNDEVLAEMRDVEARERRLAAFR